MMRVFVSYAVLLRSFVAVANATYLLGNFERSRIADLVTTFAGNVRPKYRGITEQKRPRSRDVVSRDQLGVLAQEMVATNSSTFV